MRFARTSCGASSAAALRSSNTTQVIKIAKTIFHSNYDCLVHLPSCPSPPPKSLARRVHFARYFQPPQFPAGLVPPYSPPVKAMAPPVRYNLWLLSCHLWLVCAEAVAFLRKFPSSSSARTPPAGSSLRKRVPSFSAATAPVSSRGTSSRPMEDSPHTSPAQRVQPKFASSATWAKSPAATSTASPSAIPKSTSGKWTFLLRRKTTYSQLALP